MDPLTASIVAVLSKYAVDKGATLLKEAGQAAVDAAARLFEKVIGKLKADPAEAKNAARFEQNPEGYQAPVADAVDEKLKTDAGFAAELKALLAEFEKAASTTIVNTGSGAIATQGGVAAGAGGVAVGGNVDGNIVLGSNNTVTNQNRSGGVDLNAQGGTVNITGDVVGRDKKTK